MKEYFAEAKQYFAFQWHITDDCDQRCRHCYIFSENNCKKLDSMSWEQMQEVVTNCEDFCEMYHRLPYFYITGGDPILHPDFWKLLALLKRKSIPFGPTQQVMDDIFAFIDRNKLKLCIGASYGFGDIREACMALDGGKVNGKIVVEVSGNG